MANPSSERPHSPAPSSATSVERNFPAQGGVFETLASKLSALESAVVRQEERFGAILEIGRALGSTLDLDSLLKLVMDKVTTILDADRSTLFLLDAEKDELWSKIAQGSKLREIRLPMGKGLAGWVARNGRSLNLVDAYRDERFNPVVDKISGYRTRSVLCVPMRDKGGAIVGVVQVLNKGGDGPFTPDDEQLLDAIAAQAAIALDNAQLYAAVVRKNHELTEAQVRLRHKVAELDLLYDLARSVSVASDVLAGLDGILGKAMEVIGAEAGSVMLAEEGSGQLYFRAALGGREDTVRRLRLPLGKGIAGTVAQSGKPFLSNDVRRDKLYDAELVERIGYPMRSCLCVPLTEEGRVLGAIELLNKVEGDFDEDDLKLLSIIAAESARAVAVGRLREQEAREERLASIGRMLSGVLHDFKTPMTIISGYAQLMAEERDPEERGRSATLIVKQFESINAMTREVLEFAKGKVELLVRKVNVNTFVDEVAEYLRRDFAGKDIELRLRADYTGVARFDENKIKRVIFNVARNAMQAMEPGGRFTLSVDKEGDELVWKMADTGKGIPEEIQGRLFQSFATHGKAEGTGLGLAIVKRIAEEHGGSVSYKTRAGKGTTFTVRIPA
jgi:K+-sensing histidine kinase KdpD